MSPVLALLVGYVVLVPLMLVPLTWDPHDAARLIQLGVLALAGPCMLAHRQREPFAILGLAKAGWLALTALALLAAASVLHAAVREMALREVALMTGLVVVGIAAARDVAREGTRALQIALVLSCGLYAAVQVILTIVSVMTGTGLDPTDLAAGYTNYRFFNHTQTVTLPLLAFITLRHETPASLRRVAWFALVVGLAFVFGFGARGTAVAIALVVSRRSRPELCLRLMLAGFAGLALYGLIFWVLPDVFDAPLAEPLHRSVASLSGDSSRLALWRLAIDDAARSPWTGIGPMHYAHEPNPKAAHPHNAYLQIAAEWGVPMLILVCAVIALGVSRLASAARSCADRQQQLEGVALLTACLAVLLDALVSGNVVMPVPQMWVVLVAAWALGWTHKTRQRVAASVGTAKPESRVMSLAVVLFTVSQLWLVASVWPEATDLKSHLEHVHRDVLRNAKLNPRFWSDGWF
jgi:O-antigen ligase